MRRFPRIGGVSGYGLLYSAILLLAAIPVLTMLRQILPDRVGFEVRLTAPPAPGAGPCEEPLIVTVRSTEGAPELRLDSRPVSWGGLRDALRAELRKRSRHVVYVKGDGNLEFADVVRVVDIARSAWAGVPVVLLP